MDEKKLKGEISDELLELVSGGKYNFDDFSEEELEEMLLALNATVNRKLIDLNTAMSLMTLVYREEASPSEVIKACGSSSRSAVDELLSRLKD
ncbi:MAG: hypothetical protein ACI4JZ_10335 [Oscillospiraceae bacterium]